MTSWNASACLIRCGEATLSSDAPSPGAGVFVYLKPCPAPALTVFKFLSSRLRYSVRQTGNCDSHIAKNAPFCFHLWWQFRIVSIRNPVLGVRLRIAAAVPGTMRHDFGE